MENSRSYRGLDMNDNSIHYEEDHTYRGLICCRFILKIKERTYLGLVWCTMKWSAGENIIWCNLRDRVTLNYVSS